MKNLVILSLTIAGLLLLTNISYGVNATFQVGVTIVAPPVTMDSTQNMWVERQSSVNQTPEFSQPQPANESYWEVQKTNITDGVLITYLMK